MAKKKAKKESVKAILAGVKQEMAKLRISKSAREKNADLALKA